ncbi:GGDEF domain-containing protein [Butyrivibrio sp. CB08]|uniref:GGDEF domain-containing protein n=1 Tax=Butyrivibrio sp. CB08 TaxID=2364879 RepID=UPI000EA9D70A|nr:GGDEF domain-containing protein [Butyrivibrio sp. CB08]RKM61458.1 GGDEF domain-containing protein [Butyrivibrio sp. CB08]
MANNGLLERLFDREKNQYDHEDLDGYRVQLRLFLCIHLSLEVFYILCKCTPMLIVNIVSIFVYIAQLKYAQRNDAEPALIVWISDFEVYIHAVLATIFMGFGSGFYYWIFGLSLSIIMPYQTPMRNKVQKIVARTYLVVFAITVAVFPILNYFEVLPVRYNPPKWVQMTTSSVNAIVTCATIFLYTTLTLFGTARKEQLLNKAADTDYLTGLYNRQHMQQVLAKKAEEGSLMAVSIMDVDHFKNINDTYGHMSGDYVLKGIAKLLLSAADENTVVGRWGGEEFLFIFSDGYSYDQFCHKLENLRKDIEEHKFEFSGIPISVTASFGASYISEGMTKEELVKLADARLYRAKESGRNRLEFS